jgi:hypothetical protein
VNLLGKVERVVHGYGTATRSACLQVTHLQALAHLPGIPDQSLVKFSFLANPLEVAFHPDQSLTEKLLEIRDEKRINYVTHLFCSSVMFTLRYISVMLFWHSQHRSVMGLQHKTLGASCCHNEKNVLIPTVRSSEGLK